MLSRVSISTFCLVLTYAAVASAQQRIPDEPAQASIKYQVKNFESVLRNAIELGGQEVGVQARKIVPDVLLVWVTDPLAIGWYTEDGYEFQVTIPEIGASSALLFRQSQLQPPNPGPVTPVNSGSGRPTATDVPRPDPMKVSPVAPFDPTRVFSDKVREALINAMIDNSGGLQFKPGEKLRIVAGPAPRVVPDQLNPDSRKLILTVRGEDLLAFRKGDLNRDDLIAKIQERRF